jgi:hypothetical protein
MPEKFVLTSTMSAFA